MAKKGHTTYMTVPERWLGGALFLTYLLVLPFVTGPLFRGLELLLGFELSAHTENLIYYYVLFALTVLIFWSFLGRTTGHFLANTPSAVKTAVMGLVCFYGLNELSYRALRLLIGGFSNLNDMTISAQVNDAPRSTFFIVVFLAPFVEEVLFRGYVFGNLREKHRTAAYLISCGLFAFLHVWQFAVVEQSLRYFLLMLQYLVPGLVFARCYEKSGTLWAAILPHMFVNALAMRGIL